jgi:hypothetical protein
MRLCLKKTHHKKGLLEWFKVKALSSNPNSEGKKRPYLKEQASLVTHAYDPIYLGGKRRRIEV